MRKYINTYSKIVKWSKYIMPVMALMLFSSIFVFGKKNALRSGNIKIDNEIVKAIPEDDVDRTSAEGKASSVQFIHFKFNDDQINKIKLGKVIIELGIDHKEYMHTTKLSKDNLKSLSADFI